MKSETEISYMSKEDRRAYFDSVYLSITKFGRFLTKLGLPGYDTGMYDFMRRMFDQNENS